MNPKYNAALAPVISNYMLLTENTVIYPVRTLYNPLL